MVTSDPIERLAETPLEERDQRWKHRMTKALERQAQKEGNTGLVVEFSASEAHIGHPVAGSYEMDCDDYLAVAQEIEAELE